jgi:hypothetical protein
MTRTVARIVNAALTAALFNLAAGSAGATVSTSAVSGSLSAVENTCITVSAFFYGVDCSYDGHIHGTERSPLPWVGPSLGPVFLGPGDPHGVPSYTPGEHEPAFEPPLAGTLRIDDGDTPDPADDRVSGTLSVGAAMRSHVSRINEKSPPQRAVESWSRIDHTLAPTPVTQATKNAAGGFDYVIAAAGLPPRLCRKADAHDCFPSAAAPLLTDGKWGANTWTAASPIPLGRSPALGGNAGAQTTAEITAYSCQDMAQGAQCAKGINLWGGPEDPGWDNLLLAIRTDASGQIVQAEGFWLNETRIEAGPAPLRAPAGQDNSWVGGYLTLQRNSSASP